MVDKVVAMRRLHAVGGGSSPTSPPTLLDFDDGGPSALLSTAAIPPNNRMNNNHNNDDDNDYNNRSSNDAGSGYGYRVYPKRWVMLFYLSMLNLLSDWSGLSVAPISTITTRAYNSNDDYIYMKDYDLNYIQPESLVTCFLVASSIGTALEPWILGRLGLRRTIVFGAFCNMVGNLVKSGGIPPLLHLPTLHHGIPGTYALYAGFFLVGFANPLFQCTPSLLSAAWFPQEERTLATSVALNANQLGVGLAFIVGALYVQSPSQIANYFSLLSIFSIFAFVGTALQLEDAPPTPPSGSSRIMKGTLEVSVRDIIQRASSSLLVRNTNAGNYDFDAGARLWGRDGVDGGTAVADAASVSSASGALNASAHSLLRRHVSPHRDESSRSSASRCPPVSPAWYDLASPYSVDESTLHADCEGAEPTLTQTPHHLEIDIRDDQIFLAAKACLSRRGFSHCLAVFTCVGIVINVLSTYLDYLVRGDYHDYGDGGGDANANGNQSGGGVSTASIYVAVIGALFQVIIMLSSMVIGSFTDRSRSYFVVTLVLMVLSVVALAECGVSLDEHRAGNVRWSLLLASGCLGPLLPVAAELAVELAYPLSENTVLVIMQLSCNLFSALFIPLFKVFRDVGVSTANAVATDDDGAALVLGSGRPPYTFSFYLLIVISSVSAVYFATFDGKYLRYEAELAKKRRDDPEVSLGPTL